MALINTLRNKMGKVVVAVIAFAILSFVLADLMGPNSQLFGNDTTVGEISGETISIQEFQDVAQQQESDYSLYTNRQPTENERPMIRDQAWEFLIAQYAYNEEYEALGLEVPADESIDMISGKNMDPTVRSFFTNQQTGQFERESLVNFLRNFNQQPPIYQSYWNSIKRNLVPSRQRIKYENMLIKSAYATSAEAQRAYHAQNDVAEVRYLYIPYYSMSDSSVSVTDAELNAYLTEHSEEYKTEATRSLKYVSFPIIPSSADSMMVKEEVDALVGELAQVQDDSLFAILNSDVANAYRTYSTQELPARLQEMADSLQSGQIYGPYLDFNGYTVYKISDVEADTALFDISTIVREIYASDETRDVAARQADLFASESTDLASFEANAKEQGLAIIPVNGILQNARRFGGLSNAREIVQWAYREAEIGDVSEDIEVDEQYVVSVLTAETEKGTQKLENVRNEISSLVKEKKKADLILEKLNGVSGTLEEIAAVYGDGAEIASSSDLKLSANILPNVGFDPAAVGVAFSLDNGETSAPFAGEDGVLIIEMQNKTISPEIADYTAFAQQVKQNEVIRTTQQVTEAIKDHANVKDMRYKFY